MRAFRLDNPFVSEQIDGGKRRKRDEYVIRVDGGGGSVGVSEYMKVTQKRLYTVHLVCFMYLYSNPGHERDSSNAGPKTKKRGENVYII